MPTKFQVEAWAPEYGTATAAGQTEEETRVETEVEKPNQEWAPISPDTGPVDKLYFVDGVRRIEANIWLEPAPGEFKLGLCASYASGVIECNATKARVVDAQVERGLFTEDSSVAVLETAQASYPLRPTVGETTDQLVLGVQQRMRELEWKVSTQFQNQGLLIRDGPLSAPQAQEMVGYIKRHYVHYLPSEQRYILEDLKPGSRTPLFLTTTSWSRYSWYQRLPTRQVGLMSGIVRAEVAADLGLTKAVTIADQVAATLPRFASEEHKDSRAPQNLYPIAGLEDHLRHQLGNKEVLFRALRRAAN